MDNDRTYYNNEAKIRAVQKTTAFIVFALGVGAVVGLIFAPICGHDMRENLTNGLEHDLEQSVNQGHDMRDSALNRAEREPAESPKTLEDKVGEWYKV